MSDITLLNKNIHKTFEWLKNIEDNMDLEYEDKALALAVLRAVIHELRDNLTVNTLAHFSAQLPTVIRGIFFEGWNPSHVFIKKKEFIQSVRKHLPEVYANEIDMEKAIKAVFATIAKNIDKNEFEKLRKILPKAIRQFIR